MIKYVIHNSDLMASASSHQMGQPTFLKTPPNGCDLNLAHCKWSEFSIVKLVFYH